MGSRRHPQNLSPSHPDLFWGRRNPPALQLAELSEAMDGHALQPVLGAGEEASKMVMLPQR